MRKAILGLLSLAIILFTLSCESVSAQKLPTLNPVITGNKIEWEGVEDALQYQIVTDEQTLTTTNTVFYFGEYTGEIKLRCLGDGKTYAHSDWAYVKV